MAALLGLACTLALGRWQLSRAAQKEALQAAIQAQRALPPVAAAELLGAPLPASLLHRTVQLRGSWVAERTVFLDNRQLHGKPGFFVLTPLRLADSPRAVLVQRGWVQRNFVDRSALPAVATPAGEVRVAGRIAPPPSKLYAFDGVESGPIRQNLDLAAFAAESGLPLLGVSVLQTGAAEDGLLRDWPEADFGTAKHYGYAAQWFGLAGLIAALFIWFRMIRPFLLRRRAARDGI